MKLVISTIALMWLAMPAGRVSAAPVDCEAARCTVQAEIDAECPCGDAKNHGRYTSCVARIVNRLSREGSIPRKCRNEINGCAIRSTCGKRDSAVTCDFPGDGVSGRCRPLSTADACTSRGGTIVSSCCESCGAVATATPEEPTATPTPEEPVATETATPGDVATETPLETATPAATATEEGVATPTAIETPAATATEGPGATATEGPVATATEGPIATATEGPIATATEGPGATATPVATSTEGAVATATDIATATAEAPTPTATPEGPVETATSTPEPTVTSTPGGAAVCGDSTVSGTEACDPPGSATCPNAGNGLEICSMDCTCDCPSRISFTGDAADPLSVLDTGWTGIAHRAPIITNGAVTVAVTCPDPTTRPCGTCTTAGPIANTLAGQFHNQRCSNDTAIECTDDTPCTGGGGTCEFFFGSNLPLAAGGVTTCVVNQFNGPVSGTANIESGDAVTTALLTSRVYNGIAIDNPCPRCIGDPTLNDDGVTTGTCDAGLHGGAPCDGNGIVPGRPDFGTTSLDCPPNPAAIIATLPINLTSATDTVSRTLSSASPNCTASQFVGDKCLCDTCNTAAAEPCSSNADCPFSGGAAGICGGRRCLSGSNNGAPCTSNTGCPGGACGRPGGTPTAPSGCSDDTTVADRVMECADPDGDGEGECTIGPTDQNCTVASGHAQRGCTGDADCGGGVGTCESVQRRCFLTGGGTADISPSGTSDGTNTLTAIGAADPPVNDVSHPTLAAVFCVGPTGLPAVNSVAGLPGPGRTTLRGTALGLP
jgi:hypothetical protein